MIVLQWTGICAIVILFASSEFDHFMGFLEKEPSNQNTLPSVSSQVCVCGVCVRCTCRRHLQ